jgi:hypothetical protein
VALTETMAFMFETRSIIRPTRYALETPLLQSDYPRVWQDLRRHFAPPGVPPGADVARGPPPTATSARPAGRRARTSRRPRR